MKLSEMSISELRKLVSILLKLRRDLPNIKLGELIDEITDEIERKMKN